MTIHNRIRAGMTPEGILSVMSGGNPGAINVMLKLLETASKAQMDMGFSGIMLLFHLDTMQIYGSNIWILYKDICEENISTMIDIIQAAIWNESTGLHNYMIHQSLVEAADGRPISLDVNKFRTIVSDLRKTLEVNPAS